MAIKNFSKHKSATPNKIQFETTIPKKKNKKGTPKIIMEPYKTQNKCQCTMTIKTGNVQAK